MKQRLFFGLEPSDAARSALSELRPAMARVARGRLHSPENYHVTLAFLGMTEAEHLPLLCGIADRAMGAPFELALSGLGTFKGGSIIWAGVEPSAPLGDLHGRLKRLLAENGFPVEDVPYTPHITLGRGMRIEGELPPGAGGRFAVAHVTLFESANVEGVLSHRPLYRSAP